MGLQALLGDGVGPWCALGRSPSCCISVVSVTLVKMFSTIKMLGTVHSTGVSLVMVYDDRAGTFLCNYSLYLLFST